MPARTDYFFTDSSESVSELLNSDMHMDTLDFIVSFLAQNLSPETFAICGMYPVAKVLSDCRIIYDLEFTVKSAQTIIKCIPILRKLGTALQTSGKISKFVMNDTEKGNKDGILTYNPDGTPFINIELTVDDLTTGTVWANIAGQDVKIACPERCLAEKLISTWSDRRARRVGDFYDVFQIIRNMRLDAEELQRNLEVKGFNPGKISTFTEENIKELYSSFGRTKLKNMKSRALKAPCFSDMALLYGEFCVQFAIAWKSNEVKRLKYWDSSEMAWLFSYPNPLETMIISGTITGPSSLAYNGMTHYDNVPITLLASDSEMHDKIFGPFIFKYVQWEQEDGNFKKFCFPNWNMPTVDKAISDFMLAIDVFADEELLIEAISDFMRSNPPSEIERLKSYCTAHGNSSFKILQYFADAASMLEY